MSAAGTQPRPPDPYLAFSLPWAPPVTIAVRSRIERVPADLALSKHLAWYKVLARRGWDVTALLAPDGRTVVLLACKAGEPW